MFQISPWILYDVWMYVNFWDKQLILYDKKLNILRMKRFWGEIKNIFVISKWVFICWNCLRPWSWPLNQWKFQRDFILKAKYVIPFPDITVHPLNFPYFSNLGPYPFTKNYPFYALKTFLTVSLIDASPLQLGT